MPTVIIFAFVQLTLHLTFILLIIHVVNEYKRMFREVLAWAKEERRQTIVKEIIAYHEDLKKQEEVEKCDV